MLPALRTLASAKLAWHKTASTLAPGAVATTHVRVGKDRAGNPRTWHVVRQPKKLVSNGAKVTGDVLLGLARKATERLVGTPLLWSSIVVTDTGEASLPPVSTNGRELGEKRGVTDRTIRTHIQELKRCGFIARYKYRGTNASYSVWINPNFIWETPQQPLEAPKTSPPEAAFSSPNRNNFPHIELLEPQETLKADISAVEKLVSQRVATQPTQAGNPLAGNAGSPSGCEAGVSGQKSGASGTGAVRRERFYHKTQARGTGARMTAAKGIVEAFWNYAKATVYRRVTFNEEAERQAKNAIWQGVFFGFEVGEPAEWKAWLKPLLRRLELAADWLARNPSRFAPLPYAEVLTGRGYFDAGNQHGFAGTAVWLRKEQARLGQAALERALDEAVLELAQRKVLDAGAPRRYQASKRARQLALPELHRYHHTKLRRLGGDEALVRFAARLQAEHLLNLTR